MSNKFRVLGNMLLLLLECCIRNIPYQFGGAKFRRWYWSHRFKKVGKGIQIEEGVIIYSPQNIECGSNVILTKNIMIQAGGGVYIGDDVMIGPNSFIWTTNHDYTVENMRHQYRCIYKPVVFENNVWTGANIKIIPGVRVGTGSVIAMGSVVTHDVPPHCVVGGSPAKVMKWLGHGNRTYLDNGCVNPTE